MASHRCTGSRGCRCAELISASEDYGFERIREVPMSTDRLTGYPMDVAQVPVKMMSWERFVEVVRMKP